MWGADPILFWCTRCSGTLVWARPAAATPAGAGPAASPPPPRRGYFWGGWRPLGSGGGGGPVLWLPSWGGCGGGWGGRPPAPPPRRASACLPLPPACPPGVYWCRGGCRAAAGVGRGPVGRRRVSAAGGGGGRGGEPPPPWFALLSSLGRPLIRLLRLRRPGRRRSAVGRQQAGRVGACLGRGAPAPRVQRPLRGGVWGRRFFGLPLSALGPEWDGGGGGGGPLVPWRRLLTARGGGRHGGPGPGGQPSAGGAHPSPAPLYLEPDPRAGPRWVPSSPWPSSRDSRRPGAAMRVSGQRLAGCGAAGSPPRSLSPPSLPREVARSLASRRTVGGA